MKVLCLCQKGNSRSVVLAWLLRKQFNHETLAAGMTITSRATRDMLYQWADRIILVVPRYQHRIPEEYRDKLRVIDAGGDPFKAHDEALIKRYEIQFDAMEVKGEPMSKTMYETSLDRFEARKAKNKEFVDELKKLLDKHDVVLSPATQDATDTYHAEFRSRDNGKTIFVEIDDDLKEKLHGNGG